MTHYFTNRGVAKVVSRVVRDDEIAGSSPVTSTNLALYAQKNSFNRKIGTVFCYILPNFTKAVFISLEIIGTNHRSEFFELFFLSEFLFFVFCDAIFAG